MNPWSTNAVIVESDQKMSKTFHFVVEIDSKSARNALKPSRKIDQRVKTKGVA